MIFLGQVQDLKVIKSTDHGIYLSSDSETYTNKQFIEDLSIIEETQILLPRKEVPENTNINDVITVFVYKDSEDRPIASTYIPELTIDGLAKLKVSQVTNIGAFLDWGLQKDLFLPYKEQTYKVASGDEIIVSLYADKSRRLCATMKIHKFLSTNCSYQKDDRVTGIVYEIIENFGAFVVVDDQYSALIPKSELSSTQIKVGDQIHARVTSIHEDGKINLSTREKSHIQSNSDSALILTALKDSNSGFLPYHDKSNPEEIKSAFHLSKNAFKRAIGHLLKNGDIRIAEDGIYLIK